MTRSSHDMARDLAPAASDLTAAIPAVPVLAGATPRWTHDHLHLGAIRLCRAPRLLQQSMARRARAAFDDLMAMSERALFAVFEDAADLLTAAGGSQAMMTWSPDQYAMMTARTSGLPPARVLDGFDVVARDMRSMREIVSAQSITADASVFRTGDLGGHRRWVPAGRTVMVRIPGNFPTINITWLQALALRRPVLLVASPRDPFTPLRLARALYSAGLPDGAISLCFDDAPAFHAMSDQIIWPGHTPPWLQALHKPILNYHAGHSKVVLVGQPGGDHLGGNHPGGNNDFWGRMTGLVSRGCGRLCTNCSALLVVDGDAGAAAVALSQCLSRLSIMPLARLRGVVPAFPCALERAGIVRAITSAIRRGARDISAELTGLPLEIELHGDHFLRPTVLLTHVDDAIFGAEFPFPFVTVAAAPRHRVVAACHGSLVVSVVGDSGELARELLLGAGIHKVFTGVEFDRPYDPREPHQGYLADFLFHKKTSNLPPGHTGHWQ